MQSELSRDKAEQILRICRQVSYSSRFHSLSEADREDMAQEAAIKVLRSDADPENPGFVGYVRQAAASGALNYLAWRARKMRCGADAPAQEDEDGQCQIPDHATPYEHLVARRIEVAIDSALSSRLSGREAELVERELVGLPRPQWAEDMPTSSFYGLRRRALGEIVRALRLERCDVDL